MIATTAARLRTLALLAAVAVLSTGCLAAAAGAGAAAAVHMSGNSAHSEIAAPLETVDARTRAVLAEMGVAVQERRETTNGFEYRGRGDGVDVKVDLAPGAAGMTSVTASAQRSAVEWDNNYARELVRRIVARS